MAALIVSGDRASKNNLRKNLIEHKKRQGYAVVFVPNHDGSKATGANLLRRGRNLGREQVAQALLAASPLMRPELDDVRERLENNDSVSEQEMWNYQRTRLELFYREPVSAALIELDDGGRHRDRIKLFESVTCPMREGIEAPKLDAASRFVRSRRQKVAAMILLLEATPIFRDRRFDRSVVITVGELSEFVRVVREKKAEIENLLGLEVRSDIADKAVQQLNAVLKQVGLRLISIDKRKSAGRTTYSYRMDAERLDRVEQIVTARKQKRGWHYVYESNGWDTADLDDGESEWREEP